MGGTREAGLGAARRRGGHMCRWVCAGPAELAGADLKDRASDHSLSSNASLPSVQSCRRLRERRAASWAVSFERLLQDPLGVRYFSVSRGASAPSAGAPRRRPGAHTPRTVAAESPSSPPTGVSPAHLLINRVLQVEGPPRSSAWAPCGGHPCGREHGASGSWEGCVLLRGQL